MTLKEWHSNQQNAQKLSVILRDPTLVAAIELVRMRIRPALAYGENCIQNAALEAAKANGAHEALDQLVSLTNPPKTQQSLSSPFEDDAIQRLKERGLVPPEEPKP